MRVIVEVKQTEGQVKSGIGKKSGKPYTMAKQEAAIFVPGKDYPVVVQMDIYVPKDGPCAGQPEWKKPGRYDAAIIIKAGSFGDADVSIDFRNMLSVVSDAKVQKAA